MTKEGKFFVYCLEIYKSAKGMTGKEAISLFRRYSIAEYIYAFYEALHTTGEKYIVNDIDMYVQARMA